MHKTCMKNMENTLSCVKSCNLNALCSSCIFSCPGATVSFEVFSEGAYYGTGSLFWCFEIEHFHPKNRPQDQFE